MSRDFTKWPRLVIVPEPGHETVTREQTNEILLRTNGDCLMSNDREWEAAVAGVLGIKPCASHRVSVDLLPWRECADWYQSIRGLDLHYVRNSRIMSSWIGGPHGWLDWDGNIGCSTWNIGKWPSESEVTSDFKQISAAFPYLDFHAQVITDEGDPETGQVAAQWRVINGGAFLVEPVERFRVNEPALTVFTRHGERGVSLARLEEAMRQLKNSVEKSDSS